MRIPFLIVAIGAAFLPAFAQEPPTLYIWTDKYIYQPGETATLRWTINPSGSASNVTVVAYRQNNQTGAKAYLPNGSTEATDIHGRTVADGFQAMPVPSTSKGVLIGEGGRFPASQGLTPNEPGMHTFVVQVRDESGARILRSAYMKIGVVDGFEDLQGNIESNRRLVNTKAYRLRGLVFVKSGAELVIEPGTFIIGQPGSQPPSALIVTREGRISAEGTRARPIIMTSAQPFGQRKPGDWGGLILLGKAPVNWPAGFGNIEGLPATGDTRYGGADPNHSCGTLRYVRVEFAGAEFQPNEEVNSFTWGGCGKLTVSEFLQSSYGLDDAFEWFGGTNDAKYLAGNYAADDYLDWQIGYTGRIQHAVVLANDDFSNRGIEADNNERDHGATPRSKPQIYNVTMIGSEKGSRDEGAAVAGIFLRRGTAGTVNNVIIHNWFSNGIDVRDPATIAALGDGGISMNGILLYDNGKNSGKSNTVEGQVVEAVRPFASGAQGQGRNFAFTNPALRRPFAYSDPDFRSASGSPVFWSTWIQPPDDGFFDQWATWLGAFGDVNWTEEWTSFLQEQDIRP